MGQVCVGVSSLQVEQQVTALCYCGDQTTPPAPIQQMSVVTENWQPTPGADGATGPRAAAGGGASGREESWPPGASQIT